MSLSASISSFFVRLPVVLKPVAKPRVEGEVQTAAVHTNLQPRSLRHLDTKSQLPGHIFDYPPGLAVIIFRLQPKMRGSCELYEYDGMELIARLIKEMVIVTRAN